MKGFTLVEILLSLAILAVLIAVSAPVYQQLQSQNGMDNLTTIVAQDMRRAQSHARASDGGLPWGVDISSNTVTLFEGSSYASRVQAYDETYAFSSDITVSGLLDVVFSELSGDPQSIGTTTFSVSSGATRTLSLNAHGTISY